MPLTATIGRARVIEVSDPESIKPDELHPYRLRRGERILFKTQNSARRWSTEDFIEDFVYVSQGAARYPRDTNRRRRSSLGGRLPEGRRGNAPGTAGRGIWVIEGLELSEVEPGEYELICLPVKIERSAVAPARAILRPV